ncbi:type II toxin-antitoxin system MqsA family antitoxin [Bdellovibrio sp. BCCA]|uniref:type II toxin-antitoxin system MqsA family antitoxin n=1 Tax=Bdellovibrio sp. BCCA TaxID=3136281 RepID=UPI0030F11290
MSKCPMCGSAVEVRSEKYDSYTTDTSGNQIVLDVNVNHCVNTECAHSWIPYAEEQRVSNLVASLSRHRLNAKLIENIRTALDFPTRSSAAHFLNVNEKAFTKWEKGYSPISDAYDLLLRLSIFSRQNYEFIQKLHEKKFKFEVEDYELLCDKFGLEWRYRQPTITNTRNFPDHSTTAHTKEFQPIKKLIGGGSNETTLPQAGSDYALAA